MNIWENLLICNSGNIRVKVSYKKGNWCSVPGILEAGLTVAWDCQWTATNSKGIL
jgi:hypothetical protein